MFTLNYYAPSISYFTCPAGKLCSHVCIASCYTGNYHTHKYLPEISNLYYKRVDPYLWTEYAPVPDGCGSHRRHPRHGPSVDHVCVIFVARVDRWIFTLCQKRIHGGSAFTDGNNNNSNGRNGSCLTWLATS